MQIIKTLFWETAANMNFSRVFPGQNLVVHALVKHTVCMHGLGTVKKKHETKKYFQHDVIWSTCDILHM